MAMYEGSAAVPMIVKGKGIPKGQYRKEPVHLLDIPATALNLAEIEKPHDWPGIDLIESANSTSVSDRVLFSEYHDGGSSTGIFMVVWDDWKYIAYAGHEPQLFNLAEDPDENFDLAQSQEAHHRAAKEEGYLKLLAICNPDEVNKSAFNDQKKKIAELGGIEACLSAKAFNATPTPV